MQGKLGKAVKICYGHATVMLLEASFRKLSQIAALIMLYISARDGVYTRYLYPDLLYPFRHKQNRVFLFAVMSGNYRGRNIRNYKIY